MRTNGHGKVIVALDIDGTLGDWHSHFLRFAEEWTGKTMPKPSDINPGMRLHKFMKVSLREYRECKLAFRQSGLKRSMPAYAGASLLTQRIREMGGEVWLCTTRPYLRLDNIDPDTREWIRRNDIRYDAVLFGDDKYRELKRQAGRRVGAVFDDLYEMCDKAVALGFTAYIRDQPYNRYRQDLPRVMSCWDIWNEVIDNFAYWEAKALGG